MSTFVFAEYDFLSELDSKKTGLTWEKVIVEDILVLIESSPNICSKELFDRIRQRIKFRLNSTNFITGGGHLVDYKRRSKVHKLLENKATVATLRWNDVFGTREIVRDGIWVGALVNLIYVLGSIPFGYSLAIENMLLVFIIFFSVVILPYFAIGTRRQIAATRIKKTLRSKSIDLDDYGEFELLCEQHNIDCNLEYSYEFIKTELPKIMENIIAPYQNELSKLDETITRIEALIDKVDEMSVISDEHKNRLIRRLAFLLDTFKSSRDSCAGRIRQLSQFADFFSDRSLLNSFDPEKQADNDAVTEASLEMALDNIIESFKEMDRYSEAGQIFEHFGDEVDTLAEEIEALAVTVEETE